MNSQFYNSDIDDDEDGVNNPINITGMSSLLEMNSSKISNISEIERSIVENTTTSTHTPDSAEFTKEYMTKIHELEIRTGQKLSDTDTSILRIDKPPDRHDHNHDSDDERHDDTRPLKPMVSPRHRNVELASMSYEQKQQKILHDALRNITPQNQQDFDMDVEKINDKKHVLIEQITRWRSNLLDGGIKIDDIPSVSINDSYQDIERAYRQTQYRNDHARYCGFVNESVQSFIEVLEWLFDGKKTYLGYQPFWPPGFGGVAHIKFRYLDHETSTLVSDTMRSMNIGNLGRIMIELLPPMFLHLRSSRKDERQTPVSSKSVNDASSRIRDHDKNKQKKTKHNDSDSD